MAVREGDSWPVDTSRSVRDSYDHLFSISGHIAPPGPSEACARELAYVHARSTRAGSRRASLQARHRIAAAPVALGHPHRLRPTRGQRVLPFQRDRADLVPGDDSANILLHAYGCLTSIPRPFPGHSLSDFRLRAPGNLVETAQQVGHSLRFDSPGRRSGHPGLGIHPGSHWRIRGPRPADPQRRLLVSRGRSAGCGRVLRQAPAGGPADPLGMGAAPGDPGTRLRRDHGSLALPGSQVVWRQGAEGGQAVLLPVRGHHRQRQVHPGQDPDDGPVLPRVPPGCL